MKKTLLLLATAALLLVGCAKEQLSNGVDGGMTSVTFSASVDGGVATKAAADNDGKGTNVNRCIMEIYFQNQLYKRMEAAMSGTPATATFSNVPVVAGKQYEILFWADHVDVVNTEAGLATDKYYTTTTTTDNKGLKAVTVNKTNFIDALQNKKNDELDAFFFADNYTVPQGGKSYTAKLKRPFAQLNVITTDVASGKTVISADLLPETVTVSYTAATTFNVADSLASGSTTYTYTAPVYGDKTDWPAVKTLGEFTLSMDYILAAKEKSMVDVSFQTSTGMSHSLTSLPYQRNYRTNVKGDLLTAGGTWTAKIDTIWSNPDIVKVVEVADIHSANQIINQYKETTDHLEVKFTAEPNDSGKPTGVETSPAKAIVTTPIKEGKTLSIEVLSETKELYVGDYPNEYTITSVDTDNAKAAVVNVNVPQQSKIEKLFINAPTKSVYINGKEVANVGTITDLDAITSQNTLIIEKGQTVGTLTIRQGGLEIHGTVTTLEITENAHSTNPVKVRTSENLSQAVFGVIYQAGDGGHDFIDRPDFSERQNANGTWDIVPSVCKINETNKAYGSLAAAVAVVENGQTITLIKDVVVDKPIETNKAFTLTLNADITPVSGWQTNNSTTDALVIINRGGNITINGTGKISSNGIENAYAAVKLTNKGESETGDVVKLTVEGDVILEGYYYGICGNGSRQNTEITINGGTIKGTAANDNIGIYHPQAGSLTINGGIIEGSTGIALKGGKLVVNDGTIIGNGVSATFSHNGSGWNNTGDALAVEVCDYPGQNPPQTDLSAEIKGGKFASTNGKPVASYVQPDKSYTPLAGFIFDGLFNKAPEASLVSAGYSVVENTDEATKAEYPWTVDRKHVAMIGSTKYFSLAEAVAAVPTDGTQTTITMIADHEILGNDGVTIDKTKNVILDLAGFRVKNLVNETKASQVILNKGKLTITDTAGGGLITNAASEGIQTGEWWTIPEYKYNFVTNVITNNGDLTIDRAELLETATTSICYAIDNNSNGVDAICTIKSGHISTLASTAIRMFCNSTTEENVINVEGGLIEGGYTGIWLQLPGSGSQKKKGTLNISGGTLKGTYAWYDYTFGDLFDEVKVNISGGLLDGYVFSYGANIKIEGGEFLKEVEIKQTKPSNVSVSGGKFATDLYTEGDNASTHYITGGVFAEKDGCKWTVGIADGYDVVENTNPETKDKYLWTVIKNDEE